MNLIAYLFMKIRTPKNVVRQITKIAPFQNTLGSQRVKGSQALAKSAIPQLINDPILQLNSQSSTMFILF